MENDLGARLRSLIGGAPLPGEVLELSEERVAAFRSATDDPGREAVSPLLVVSLLPRLAPLSDLLDGSVTSINYGLERMEVKRLASPGERLRARQELVSVDDIPGGFQLRRRVVVEDELGSAVIEAETLTRLLVTG